MYPFAFQGLREASLEILAGMRLGSSHPNFALFATRPTLTAHDTQGTHGCRHSRGPRLQVCRFNGDGKDADREIGGPRYTFFALAADHLLRLLGVAGALHRNLRNGRFQLAEIILRKVHVDSANVFFQPVQLCRAGNWHNLRLLCE